MTTEELILEAAEKEFLSKGYEKAKISTIAEKANVNHAMVHYYFRTKENLFGIVFKQKAELLAKQIGSFNEGREFLEQLDFAINYHFDFLLKNPNLLFFLLGEVSTNSKHLERLKTIVLPKLKEVYKNIQVAIDKEVARGTINHIDASDLMTNMFSMNAASVLFATVREKLNLQSKDESEEYFKHRRQHIKQVIFSSIEK